jgi:hypothetical protein
MPNIDKNIDTVRASRAGHTFHERWTARRALQLVVPNDDLFAIAVEGISSTETMSPGKRAEEVADLVLYYGAGDNFLSCKRLETIQFKYKFREDAVTAAYLKKTIEKFSDTILGYEKSFSSTEVASKVAFIFVTNAEFTEDLWDAIKSITEGTTASTSGAATQARNLKKWCASRGLADASRLFLKMGFRAGERSLAGQESALRRTLTDWSAGADSEARLRVQGLQELVQKKAGLSGQGKNLIRREDVLDALECETSDLFPADTRFIDVGSVVARAELSTVSDLVKTSDIPVFIHAEGGVGKTVFIQSLAARMEREFDVVVFDCFGGGSYRSDNHSRHLPSIGLIQIVNELASRTLCDPLLPSGDDSRKIIRAACRRLAQAAKAIRAQSGKIGVIVIVDAADNAQVEADYRHEEAFPKLLLSAIGEDPIDGVKLILTARTHRKDNVIGRTVVEEIELGPFSELEALEFLKARRSGATSVEIATALARSNRNARVLDYLVQTWENNVLERTSDTPITVPEIIAQRCTKIVSDLHVAGWPDSEVTEFFVALSLLPPPIPLNELANALGWSAAQVNTAASDLAPMLEITSHGAIFRDEPTETYVRETYVSEAEAQREIADRLLSSQTTSTYAAEALPHFLVIIKDSDRAFALADSADFPMAVQSEFGRRRLTLERLRAAFRLAVAENDFDRSLSLSMRLAQITTANMRGNEFIRTSPALAVVLGDADSYRRLFADRTGWRGARSARLAIAYRFAGEIKEAQIQCESTVRWTNWYVEESHDDTSLDRSGPGVADYAAVLLQHVMENEYDAVDRNLVRWNENFSLSACGGLLQLVELFDQANQTTVFADLALFVASESCSSRALKLALLSRPYYLDKRQVKALAKALGTPTSAEEDEDDSYRPDQEKNDDIVRAALTTLLYSSRVAAASIFRNAPHTRLSAHLYSERHGGSRIWLPTLSACVRAWSAGRPVAHYDLLPNDIKISREAKAITTEEALIAFLKKLRTAVPSEPRKRNDKTQLKARFSERECEDIGKCIGLARDLISSIEHAVLSRKGISSENVTAFLDTWSKYLRNGVHWRSESPIGLHARAIGFGCLRILLDHSPQISTDQAAQLIALISSGRFLQRSNCWVNLLGGQSSMSLQVNSLSTSRSKSAKMTILNSVAIPT